LALSAAEWTNREIAVRARVRGPSGRWSADSNLVRLRVEPAIADPADVHVTLIASGVEVTWAGQMGARIFRRTVDEPGSPLTAIGEPDRSPFVDIRVELGKRYEYAMETRHGAAVSRRTMPVTVLVEDRFAPTVPQKLEAVAGLNTIELSWEASPEPDLAGYRIYRSAAGGALAPLGELSALPSLSDRSVQTGQMYRYAVSSVDRLGNESERSAIAEATAP
jgi:hypothetical protein